MGAPGDGPTAKRAAMARIPVPHLFCMALLVAVAQVQAQAPAASAGGAGADAAAAPPPIWPPFLLAAFPSEPPAQSDAGISLPECAALGVEAPLYSGILYEDDPDARVIGLVVQGADARAIPFDAGSQQEYNLGTAASLDANQDGVGDLVIEFADRYGSGRDSYGALMLGCGDGAYLYSGTLRLGSVDGIRMIEPVPGGLLIERSGRPPPQDPTASARVVAGYRLDPSTFRLTPELRHTERRALLQALQSASSRNAE